MPVTRWQIIWSDGVVMTERGDKRRALVKASSKRRLSNATIMGIEVAA